MIPLGASQRKPLHRRQPSPRRQLDRVQDRQIRRHEVNIQIITQRSRKIHRHTHPTTGRHRPRQRHPVDQLPRIRKKSPIQPHRRSRRIGHLHPRHPPGPTMVHFTQLQRTGRRQTARLIRRPRRGRGKMHPCHAAKRLCIQALVDDSLEVCLG